MSSSAECGDYLKKGTHISPTESLIAGSISGAIARAVTAPLDTIKIRLQLLLIRRNKITGAELVKSLLENEGLTALWKGNVPAEALYILYGASQFTAYSMLNTALCDLQDKSHYSLSQPTHLLLVGSGTGFVSTLVTYPFDVLRTRLAADENRAFLSVREACKNIYLTGGIPGFFVGIRPSLLSIVANSGIFFWSYSLARGMVDKISEAAPGKVGGVGATCGLFAGVTAKTITFPLDTIRKRMQVSLDKNAFRMLLKHWRSYGFVNFYKGLGVSIIKSAPTSALSVAIYEYSISFMRSVSATF